MTSSGVALVVTSQSSGLLPRSVSRTQPPTQKASCPAAVSFRRTCRTAGGMISRRAAALSGIFAAVRLSIFRAVTPSGIRAAFAKGFRAVTPSGACAAFAKGFRAVTPSGIRAARSSGTSRAAPFGIFFMSAPPFLLLFAAGQSIIT